MFPPGRRHDFTPEFVVPHGVTRIQRGGVHARQALLLAPDITTDFGVLTTTPIRTASDLLRRQYRPYALASTDQMARAGLIDIGDLSDLVHHLKGYPGIRQARSLVSLIDPRAESPGESWARLRLHDAGFPTPDLQVVTVDSEGIERRLDMAYLAKKIGVEFDGRENHSLVRDVVRDSWRRDDLTHLYGWRWVIADYSAIFGTDTTFEDAVGRYLEMTPIRRWWGHRNF